MKIIKCTYIPTYNQHYSNKLKLLTNVLTMGIYKCYQLFSGHVNFLRSWLFQFCYCSYSSSRSKIADRRYAEKLQINTVLNNIYIVLQLRSLAYKHSYNRSDRIGI